jgi:hypothetical protein
LTNNNSTFGVSFAGWLLNGGKYCMRRLMLRDVRSQQDFQIIGLYKFWAIKGMRAQVRFLQTLITNWDLDTDAFNLDGKPLIIEVDCIFLITGFYR